MLVIRPGAKGTQPREEQDKAEVVQAASFLSAVALGLGSGGEVAGVSPFRNLTHANGEGHLT